MLKIADRTSQKIRNMGLVCALCVVVIHSGPMSPDWLVTQIFSDGFTRIAVPFFFTISGFMLAQHFVDRQWWCVEAKKRIFSLFIPFCIWSAIALALAILPSVIADYIANRPFGTGMLIFKGSHWMRIFGLDMAAPPLLVPLWYVRCLLMFVLISPFIAWVVSRLGIFWLLLVFAASLLVYRVPNHSIRFFLDMGFSLSGLAYFSLGIYLRGKNMDTSRCCAALFALVGIFLLIAKAVLHFCGWRCSVVFGQLAIPFLLYASWHFIPVNTFPRWLTDCSFPIFLMHMLFQPYVELAVKRTLLHDIPFVEPSLKFIFSCVGSIAVASLLRKYWPATSRILFGGR